MLANVQPKEPSDEQQWAIQRVPICSAATPRWVGSSPPKDPRQEHHIVKSRCLTGPTPPKMAPRWSNGERGENCPSWICSTVQAAAPPSKLLHYSLPPADSLAADPPPEATPARKVAATTQTTLVPLLWQPLCHLLLLNSLPPWMLVNCQAGKVCCNSGVLTSLHTPIADKEWFVTKIGRAINTSLASPAQSLDASCVFLPFSWDGKHNPPAAGPTELCLNPRSSPWWGDITFRYSPLWCLHYPHPSPSPTGYQLMVSNHGLY